MLRTLVSPLENNLNKQGTGKWFLCNEYGEPVAQPTSLHSEEARTFIWKHTLELINKNKPK